MPLENEISRGHYPKVYGPMATLAQVNYVLRILIYLNTSTVILQSLAVVAQSFLSIGMGMEFSISTIVIRVLHQKSKNDFSMSITEAAWYGMLICPTIIE